MKRFFYIDSQQQQVGPCSVEELASAGIKRETMVWFTGIADWTPAGDISELDDLFSANRDSTDYPGRAAGMTSASPAGGYMRNSPDVKINMSEKPDSWLAWAIIVTIFCCCPPFGIPAIVYASKVDGLWFSGQFDKAKSAAKTAKTWTIVTVCAGFLFWIIYALFIFFAVAAAGMYGIG